MKLAYHILTHLFGVGCVAACIAIVATMGALDIHWSGWVGVGFFAMLVLGILAGWFPWRGRPLQVMVKGFYVMSALALIGFGFAMDDPMRVHLWMVLAALGAAIVLRIILKVIFHLRDEGEAPKPAAPSAAPKHDVLL
jgi:hypothetical protein